MTVMPRKRGLPNDATKKRQGRAQRAPRRSALWTWIPVAVVLGLGIYGVSQTSNIRYREQDLGVVDFSSLDAKQKQTALEAANRARCTCGCGLGLAECVVTDMTCPLRAGNITRIKSMVDAARGSRPAS